ncbi:MAG TPA: hypothetical protein VJB35_03010 [Candidatus Nanoarchaeia archaeon]|nr:hypothetical protein [Candidatus Nanoarchaeia archaeon]
MVEIIIQMISSEGRSTGPRIRDEEPKGSTSNFVVEIIIQMVSSEGRSTGSAYFKKIYKPYKEVNFMKNLYFECKSKERLKEELLEGTDWKIPLLINKEGQEVFKGFDFFSPARMISPDITRFILAKEIKENPKSIVGVLKTGVYNDFGELPNYWAINFIDIREDKRKQKIATELYQELNKMLTPEDYLVGTYLSKLGRDAKLHQKRKEIITICPNFDTSDDFWEYCEENGLIRDKFINYK